LTCDEDVASCKEAVDKFLADAHVVTATSILRAAQAPFPTIVRSLDAIHPASAMAVRAHEPRLVFVSRDQQQVIAAGPRGLRLYERHSAVEAWLCSVTSLSIRKVGVRLLDNNDHFMQRR
jgi:hypothetical protein